MHDNEYEDCSLHDQLRASPNDPDGLTKEWVFNGDKCAIAIRRQQSGSVAMIWGGMIGNELTAWPLSCT